MILVRDIFHLKFGQAKDAKSLLNEFKEIGKKMNFPMGRALTDLVTDRSYTLILESDWKSLADWEDSMKSGMGNNEWQKWYQKFIPLCESAKREIYNVL
jgi:hypothetical protein